MHMVWLQRAQWKRFVSSYLLRFTLKFVLIFQVLVAPPAELPESDDDGRNESRNVENENLHHRQVQQHRRGPVQAFAASSADGYSSVRLNARSRHENEANQASSSSHPVQTPKVAHSRSSVAAAISDQTPVTPSLRQQLRQHSASRPASAPARGRGEVVNATVGAADVASIRSRALPSRVANATAIAAAAARQTAEEAAESDQRHKKQQDPTSLKRASSSQSRSNSGGNKNLPTLLYKDAEFRTLRRQLLGVQQELIMEQSATP